MASRGRGRGFGRGGGGFGHAVQTRFELFPDVELPDPNMVPVERNIIQWNTRLLNYWKSSPYYLEDAMQKSEL
ncbi:hypothetical protein JRO89_XS09G0189900 [Xanthoceras sorbifolium]|uniref:Uncharacterized protein n=1 Tax=Xanthoceras sorbifolium TaxID=99658 RepID=A0ABQ8HLU5_9ROSI|nr:hypothetical protein JRO89_XS09G0189900 [Xanthoceras sorbifolium]